MKEALTSFLHFEFYGSEIPFANSNRYIIIDKGIINAIFERMLNTFTVIFLDLIPKIIDTINPRSIKTYKKIRIHRFIFGDLNTKKIINALKNNTKVKIIG